MVLALAFHLLSSFCKPNFILPWGDILDLFLWHVYMDCPHFLSTNTAPSYTKQFYLPQKRTEFAISRPPRPASQPDLKKLITVVMSTGTKNNVDKTILHTLVDH